MKTAMKAASAAGLGVFFVFSLPLTGTYGEMAFDTVSFICFGSGNAETVKTGATANDRAPHDAPEGLYMPMFSTPPKGGKVYNGPPLDEC